MRVRMFCYFDATFAAYFAQRVVPIVSSYRYTQHRFCYNFGIFLLKEL